MQATGKRAKYLIVDDLLKGEVEANDIDLQKRLVNRYDSDWTSRADDDEQKLLVVGTMWSPSDLLNVLEVRAGQLIDDVKYRFTRKSADGYEVYISIPALDENEESTCPARYSTSYFKKKRALMDEFLWSAEYQQNPKSALSRAFDYDSLQQYDEIGRSFEYSRKAVLDPARKGKNYVAMPVFYEKDGKHYLVDFLYKKKTMKELYEEIVNMIIKHRLTRFTIENNTDTSLAEIIKDKLKQKGYYSCQIEEIYTSKKKELKIMDAKATIHSCLWFPRKGKYPITTDIGKAMEEIDYYSFDFPNKYDDAIDSVAMYCDCYVENSMNFPEVGTFRR